ncbi:MAG: hypothetical protein JTJ11_03775 [Collinsella sp.]|nr:hypothetical protein [Collinsella sp.]
MSTCRNAHGGAHLLVGEGAGTYLACVQAAALLWLSESVAQGASVRLAEPLITPVALHPYVMYSSTVLILSSYECIHPPNVVR